MTQRNAPGKTPPLGALPQDLDVQRLVDCALLLSDLIHELRTPLGSIVGGASVLDQYAGKLDEAGKSRICAGIMDQAHRLDSLFTALAAVARVRTGTLVRHEQVLELNELLRGLWAADHNAGGASGGIELLREEVFVKADPAAVRVLVTTMLALALYLAPDDCGASLTLTVEPGMASINVACPSREDMRVRIGVLIGDSGSVAPSKIEPKTDAICLAAIREVVHSLGGDFDIQHNDENGQLSQTARLTTRQAPERLGES